MKISRKKHTGAALVALALSSHMCVAGSADTQPMATATGAKADVAGTSNVTTVAVQPGAVKSVWASGLRAPQGMARDAAGNVYVAEYQGGQVSKFSPEGTALGAIGTNMKNPAWLAFAGNTLYVSERKANRVLKGDAQGNFAPLGDAVIEPLGLAVDAQNNLVVVAHTTSRVLRIGDGGQQAEVFAASTEGGKKYGYRCIAVDRDGSLFVTDEAENNLLLITPAGRVAVWASELDDPTSVVLSPRGEVFVAEEGAGRISRIDARGNVTRLADGLGKPRDIEFIDERTLLVSDTQNGRIWKVVLP